MMWLMLLFSLQHERQVADDDDSDGEPSTEDKALETKVDVNDAQHSHLAENVSVNVQRSPNEKDPPNMVSSQDSPLSMGDILSSLDAGISLPGPGPEYSVDRQSIKSNGTQMHVKRSNFWGRNNVSENFCPLLYLVRKFMLLEGK